MDYQIDENTTQPLLIILLIVLVGILLIFRPWAVLSHSQKYQIITDLLGILLAFIAIIGFGVYKLMQGKIMEEVRRERDFSRAENALHTGYTLWEIYEKTQEGDKKYPLLEKAIELTERSLKLVERISGIKERKRIFILGCKNNLAYYLTERGDPKDKERIKAYLEDLIEAKKYYPTHATEWMNTCKFAKTQLKEMEKAGDEN